jgi:hypothetical protein
MREGEPFAVIGQDQQQGPIYDAIELLERAEHVDFAVVVLADRSGATQLWRLPLLFTLWKKFDHWLFSDAEDALTPDSKLLPLQTIPASAIDGTDREEFSDRDRERIRACDLDVLVQLGSGRVPEGILSCAKYGVQSAGRPRHGRCAGRSGGRFLCHVVGDLAKSGNSMRILEEGDNATTAVTPSWLIVP